MQVWLKILPIFFFLLYPLLCCSLCLQHCTLVIAHFGFLYVHISYKETKEVLIPLYPMCSQHILIFPSQIECSENPHLPLWWNLIVQSTNLQGTNVNSRNNYTHSHDRIYKFSIRFSTMSIILVRDPRRHVKTFQYN